MNSQNCQKNETTKNTQDTKNLSELSALSGLPGGWSWVKLGEVAISIKGKKPKRQSNVKDSTFSIPYVDIKAFENRGIDNFTDGVNCIFCEPDDVLIVWDGARCGLVGRGIKGAIGSTLAKIKSQEHIDSFLFYFLQMNYKLINSNPKGVGIPHIEPNLFWNLTIPLPPLHEQKKIVEKIEELFSQLDSGVAALKKAKEQIRLYRQSVLAAAFSGKLTTKSTKDTENLSELSALSGLPNGWKWVKLGDIGEVVAGGTPSTKIPEYFDGEIAWITPADLTGYTDKYISRGRRNISDAGLKNSSARIVPKGSVLFSSRAPIGYVAIASNELCTNQGFKNLILNNKVHSEFVYYYLKSAKQLAEKNASGTTFKEISAKNFANLPFPLPPLAEQKKIVSEIEKRFSEADNLEKAIDESLAKAETLRQSILKQAFEGKLV